MKPLEILSSLPQWAKATPDAILDSPAFAMACRQGDEPAVLRPASVEPAAAETLALSVAFGDEPHTLRLARSTRFPDLDKLWDSRADVPEPILLALVERECGPLFQLLENAVRKQLRIVGVENPAQSSPSPQKIRLVGVENLAQSSPSPQRMRLVGVENPAQSSPSPQRFLFLCVATSAETSRTSRTSREEIVFSLTRSASVVSALGVLRNLDLAHEAIRSQTLAAEVEHAAFQLPDADLASLAPGDAVMLPEIGAVQPRLIADGRFVVDGSGVAPFKEDSMCRIRDAAARTVSLGELFDAAAGEPLKVEGSQGAVNVANVEMLPTTNVANDNVGLGVGSGNIVQLRLVKDGKTAATGRLDRVGDQPAFVVESLNGSIV